jgi:hypothetical protein
MEINGFPILENGMYPLDKNYSSFAVPKGVTYQSFEELSKLAVDSRIAEKLNKEKSEVGLIDPQGHQSLLDEIARLTAEKNLLETQLNQMGASGATTAEGSSLNDTITTGGKKK